MREATVREGTPAGRPPLSGSASVVAVRQESDDETRRAEHGDDGGDPDPGSGCAGAGGIGGVTVIHDSRLTRPASSGTPLGVGRSPYAVTTPFQTREGSTSVAKKSAISAWESLFRAQVTVMRALTAEFPRDADLSFTEYDVLFTISKQEGWSIRLRDLRRQVLLTQPSVSRLVDRLVERGLVSKCPEPDDGRGSLVRLTDEGYALYRHCAVAHGRSIIDHVGSALSPAELEQLEELCEKLRLSVEARNVKPA